MELIDRYIHDVSRRLPRRLRDDVEKELRSSLYDALEARGIAPEQQGQDGDDAKVVELLRQFGKPADLAASYRTGPNFVVGPALYPAFLRTVKVVLIAIVVIFVAMVVVDAVDEPNMVAAIAEGFIFSNIISELVSVLGWIVLIFWIIQLVSAGSAKTQSVAAIGPTLDATLPESTAHAHAHEWDPTTLPAVNDPDRISRTELIVEMAFLLVFCILLSVFPDKIGGRVTTDGESHWVALLGPGAIAQRTWFLTAFVAIILLNVVLLKQGRWSIPTRGFEVMIDLVLIAALWPLAAHGGIIANEPADLIANGWSPSAAENLSDTVFPFLDYMMRIILGVAAVAIAAHAVTRSVKLMRRML